MSTFVVGIVKSLVHSPNLESFCENLVFTYKGFGSIRGMEIYTREKPGSLKLLHKLTDGQVQSPEFVSLNQEDSLAKAFAKQVVLKSMEIWPSVCVPIEIQGMLMGALRITFSETKDLETISDEEAVAVATAASSFLGTELKAQRRKNYLNERQASELSPRQLAVFERMSKGDVYSQIARDLHISESLVRLEASRIFRFLDVSNRSEAILAGNYLLTPPPAN